MNAADSVAVGVGMARRAPVAGTTAEQAVHTFRVQPLSHLFGGIVMVATAVILAALIGAQTAQSILFRTLFGLGCLLYAWFGERLARARVEVRGSRLIVHDSLRTRAVNASDIREITWDWLSKGGGTRWVAPRVHLANGGSIRLSGLWSYGSRWAELATMVEEILTLLGVHVPVDGRSPDPAPAPDPDSSLSGVHVPAQEQLPDQAAAPDSASRPASQSPAGLPTESVGAPRPPRHFGKNLLKSLPYVLGGTLGILYVFSAAVRVLVILLYAVLAVVSLVRFVAGSRRGRRARSPRR